jgi:ceramide glucosyltransferase
MLTAVSICLAISASALALHALGAWATLRQTARKRSVPPTLPPLSLLKPIKGLEEELETNLRSFFEQHYPAPVSFVFASTDADDPGMLVARRVARFYPEANVRFVISDSAFGANPKVSNVAGALAAAEHDLVLQTDANVRLRPGYLTAVVGEFLSLRASLLGALVAGMGERSWGAALENVQLSTFTTPGICLAYRLFRIPCVIGKSILYRKSELHSLGGLSCVKDVLAEDFVLGQVYERAGKRVVLSSLPVDNVNIAGSIGRFAARHTRWLQMRVVVHVPGFLADLFSNAALFVFLAALCSGELRLWLAYAVVAVYKAGVDALLLARVRGHALPTRYLAALALRDLLQPLLWLSALVSRTTEWRGKRFRLARGSRLIPLPSPLAAHSGEISALGPSSHPNHAPPPVEHRG